MMNREQPTRLLRNLSITLVILLLLVIAPVSGLDDSSVEEFLPIGLTELEKQKLDEIGKNHRSTAAPSGTIRNSAEWEPSQGVIIRWPLGIPVSLVADYSKGLMVTTIVGSSSQQSSATSYYSSNGVTMANTQFVIAPTNSIWTRDYGPWFIFNNDQLGIVDPIYNRPRPYDDVIPQVLSGEWSLPYFGMDLITPGGNHMSDGLGISMSTELVYDENPTKTENEVDSLMLAYLGNDYTVLNYIESGGIHHIDCWAKFLSPTTVMVKDVPTSSSSYHLLNDRAEQLSQQISEWGQPYTVVRIYCPYGTAYTNSIILNNRVFVPLFGSATYDTLALQTYRDAMPGYTVSGYLGSWLDDDAIHCRAMGVPDAQMLYVDHRPLLGYQPSESALTAAARIVACSGQALIQDSLKLFYSVDGGANQSLNLSTTAYPDSFSCELPAFSSGSVVRYYLQAADNSGRVETHPYIGEPWAHTFTINTAPIVSPVDSLTCKAETPFSFYPNYTDPDENDIVISYSSLPAWLTVSGDSLVGNSPHDRQLADFTVTVADSYRADSINISLLVYICGDINGDAVGPDVSDLTYLVDYLFGGGTAPPDFIAADIDGSEAIDISDLTGFVDYLFGGGPSPVCQ
ncbi:MAG: agmatine deiminase family protein [bacterium]|nr:agmatine deiminase family protein [bacterium]